MSSRYTHQKHPSRGVLTKKFPENVQQITGEHPYRGAISMKLLCNFIEITTWHGCSPVKLLHIFRTPFPKSTSEYLLPTHFFYKQRYFSTQPQYCLTFSRIKLQMLLRCCLILRHFIYLLYYLSSSLDLGLFILHQCDLFFMFIFIFIIINDIISRK